jgi:hypothetical protein
MYTKCERLHPLVWSTSIVDTWSKTSLVPQSYRMALETMCSSKIRPNIELLGWYLGSSCQQYLAEKLFSNACCTECIRGSSALSGSKPSADLLLRKTIQQTIFTLTHYLATDGWCLSSGCTHVLCSPAPCVDGLWERCCDRIGHKLFRTSSCMGLAAMFNNNRKKRWHEDRCS